MTLKSQSAFLYKCIKLEYRMCVSRWLKHESTGPWVPGCFNSTLSDGYGAFAVTPSADAVYGIHLPG
eukprot:6196936-Pleurochrysis_carterae.AAC.4